MLERHVQGGLEHSAGGIADHDVKTVEAGGKLAKQFTDALRIADVGRDWHRAAPKRGEFVAQRARLAVSVEVYRRHLAAGGGQLQCNRAADAARSSGDQRYF